MNLDFFSKPTSLDWPTGHKILDDYEVMRVLGEGGMGKVYLVRSLSTGSKFAVKRAKCSNDADRKNFLAELQTWIDLPHHPNLVCCRFFRTVGDEIIIFADYIAGGTLADWISKRMLTTLEQILDVAIQLAWGLHAMHELGLIHQDMKPGNVLMMDSGIPMITDFGLARARPRVSNSGFSSTGFPTEQQSVLVSSGGMTPAYASPEQKAGKPLSRNTDIWSWAVSILDIFMGGVSCPYGGNTADHVLRSFIESGESESGMPELPQEVAEILHQCFVNDPSERTASLSTVSDNLIRIYEQKFNGKYSRIIPRCKFNDFNVLRLYLGAERRDPSTWLALARKFVGHGELSNQNKPLASSRMGMCVGDIITYEEAASLLRHSVSHEELPSIDELLTLAGTLKDYALTLASLGQRRRAAELCREAISCYARTESQSILESIEYHAALHYLASILDSSESAAEIISLTDQILSIATPRLTQVGWDKLFVCVCLQHDSALQVLGDSSARSKFLSHALSVYPHDPVAGLQRSFLVAAAANVAAEQGDIEGAIRQYEEAIAVRRQALARDQCSQRHASLFTALSNVASLHMRNEDYPVATAYLKEASKILEFLVDSAGQQEFSEQLIITYSSLSRCYLLTKQHAEMKDVLIRAESLAQRVILTNDGVSAKELMMPILALRAKLAVEMDNKMEVSHVSAKMTAIYQGKSVSAYAEKAHRESRSNDPDTLGAFKKQNGENVDKFEQLVESIFNLKAKSICESFGPGEVTLACEGELGETTSIIITKSIDDNPFSLHVTLSGGNDAVTIGSEIYIPILHDLLLRKGWLDDKLNRKMNWLTQGVLVTNENIQQVLAARGSPAYQWYEPSGESVQELADQGYAEAQCKIGNYYLTGKGVPKDETEAAKWWHKAAVQGDAEAQYNLGVYYKAGETIARDDTQSAKWYREAAEQGYIAAQRNLGLLYLKGEGVTKNVEEAANWFRKAAVQGDASAQFNLGICYLKGLGVSKDETEAVRWYQRAAEQGHAGAQFRLGVCCARGDGAARDAVEAVNWIRMAADQGLADAQNSLGYSYSEGFGVPKDVSKSIDWYHKAAEQGHESARNSLRQLTANQSGTSNDESL